MWAEELDDALIEGGTKALWKLYYELRTVELLEKYPNTTGSTVQLAVKALQDFNQFEATSLAPNGGGRDQQTVEWVTGINLCHAAKNKADEERETQRLLEEGEGNDEPDYPKADEDY